MDITALLLSRLQFAFTISFHIIFPSFTIASPPGSPFSRRCISRPVATCTGWSSSFGSRYSASHLDSASCLGL